MNYEAMASIRVPGDSVKGGVCQKGTKFIANNKEARHSQDPPTNGGDRLARLPVFFGGVARRKWRLEDWTEPSVSCSERSKTSPHSRRQNSIAA